MGRCKDDTVFHTSMKYPGCGIQGTRRESNCYDAEVALSMHLVHQVITIYTIYSKITET